MTPAELEQLKELLTGKSTSISEWLESPSFKNDGDVMKVQSLLDQIDQALTRIEKKTYGQCSKCDGEVEFHRLEIQPAETVCLECISDSERAVLQEELSLASKIHRALLPQKIEKIDGFDIVVKSIAARTVGGDYYDFIPGGDDGFMRVVIADVMGKGIPAGLLMSNFQGALRILAEDIESQKMLLSRLNKWFCRNVPMTKFISLACVAIEIAADGDTRISYTNAGHCPPILVRANGNTSTLEPTGGVIGIHEDFRYEEEFIEMSSGDLLVLYTDGVTEAENSDGEQYGDDRLKQFLSNHSDASAPEIPELLVDEVRAFTGRQEFADDFTLIALKKS